MEGSLQFRYGRHTYLFTHKIGFLLLCIALLSLFLLAGTWQLHRYVDKKSLLATYQSSLSAEPKPFHTLNISNQHLQFLPVVVDGHYVNKLTMLLQHQYHQGSVGFDVLTPLRITGEKKLLLVDRGFIRPTNKIDAVNDEQHIRGYIKELDEHPFTLGKNILNPKASPLVMQKIDFREISQITHETYFPFILRQNASDAHGFLRDWTITTILPERHMAYAIQWFALAILVVIAYFCFCCEKLKP